MRPASSQGEMTEKAIRRAAVEIIARHGFEAASLRLIAKEVGIQAPSLYNYIKSKEQLLFDLLREPLVSMIAQYKTAAALVPDPFERLQLFIGVHLDFHLDFTQEVFIGNMELRNLKRPHYKVVTALRDEYSMMLTGIIEDGVKSGRFQADNPRITTFALLSMLSGVCNWYRPDGPLSKEAIVRNHTILAMRMLGISPEASMEKTANRAAATTKPRKREKDGVTTS